MNERPNDVRVVSSSESRERPVRRDHHQLPPPTRVRLAQGDPSSAEDLERVSAAEALPGVDDDEALTVDPATKKNTSAARDLRREVFKAAEDSEQLAFRREIDCALARSEDAVADGDVFYAPRYSRPSRQTCGFSRNPRTQHRTVSAGTSRPSSCGAWATRPRGTC